MKKTFLADIDSWTSVIEEESTSWVNDVIVSFGLDPLIVFSENKTRAVEYLVQNKVSIDFNIKTSAIKIHKDGILIAEWRNQETKTKIEDGLPFVEITVDVTSVKDKTMPGSVRTK